MEIMIEQDSFQDSNYRHESPRQRKNVHQSIIQIINQSPTATSPIRLVTLYVVLL